MISRTRSASRSRSLARNACTHKVHRKRERGQHDRPDAFSPGPQKETHVRLTETVNRLHWVADEKQRPSITGLPLPYELGQKLVLALGRVLKPIDEQVLDPAVDGKRQVRGLRICAERDPCADRDLGEIHAALVLKDQPELTDRDGKKHQQRTQHVPLRGFEPGGRERAHRVQPLDDRVVELNGIETLFGLSTSVPAVT